MAVVNLKGTAVNTGDAPPTGNPSQSVPMKLHGGRIKESVGTITTGAADSIGSTYRLVRVQSDARITAVRLSSGAVTGAAANVGVYDTAVNGGAVVNASLFAAAASLAAAQSNVDVMRQSGTVTVDKIEQPLWQLLGLPKDPGKLFDIVATLTAAATAAAPVALSVCFVDGN